MDAESYHGYVEGKAVNAGHLVSVALVVDWCLLILSIINRLRQIAVTSIPSDHAHECVQGLLTHVLRATIIETIPQCVKVTDVLVGKEVLKF
jgi:hypothetical protein